MTRGRSFILLLILLQAMPLRASADTPLEQYNATKNNTLGDLFPKTVAAPPPKLINQPDIDPAEQADFDTVYEKFVNQTALLKFFKDDKAKQDYLDWWKKNESQFITQAKLKGMKDTSLQMLLGVSYSEYAEDSCEKAQDTNKCELNTLQQPLQSNWVQKYLKSTTAWLTSASIGFGIWLSNSVNGAFVAGPVAGLMNSYTSRFTGPLNDKLTAVGARHLATPSKWLQKKLNKTPEIAERQVAVGNAALDKINAIADALPHKEPSLSIDLRRFKYPNMSASDLSSNYNRLVELSTELNQAFAETVPLVQGGRTYIINSMMDMPRQFATSLAVFDSNMEQHAAQLKSIIKRLQRKGFDRDDIMDLLRTQDQLRRLPHNDPSRPALEAEITKLTRKLKEQGLSSGDYADLISHYKHIRSSQRKSASTIAEWMMYDFMNPELGRIHAKDKPDLAENMEAIKEWMGRDEFLDENIEEVRDILKQLQFRMKLQVSEAEKFLNKVPKSVHLNVAPGECNKEFGLLSHKK